MKEKREVSHVSVPPSPSMLKPDGTVDPVPVGPDGKVRLTKLTELVGARGVRNPYNIGGRIVYWEQGRTEKFNTFANDWIVRAMGDRFHDPNKHPRFAGNVVIMSSHRRPSE